MDRPRAVVVVTGCSTGIGRAAVVRLRRAGAFVVATARDASSIQDLHDPGHVEVERLDVTSDQDREDLIASVLRRHGRIDALVNNAGHGATLAVEDTSLEAMRAMFEVNLFGLHDLARRVLPAMRRQGAGRIVNVASVAGHVAVPLLGAYCASKFAVRALTQALDMEVRGFGVRAVLVEPGPIATRFGQRATAEQQAWLSDPASSPYAGMYRRWGHLRGEGGRGARPEAVARKVVHACLAATPRNHYFVPASARALNIAKRVLPDAWTMAALRLHFRAS